MMAIVALGCLISLKMPQVHNVYLREAVAPKVYYIVKEEGGGGSGFQIKGKSGKSYLMTNDHVCEGTTKDGQVMVKLEDGRLIPRRILEHSRYTDLCIIEGMPGVEGLSLGQQPAMGETLYAVGHPALRPMTVNQGEFEGLEDVRIEDHEIREGEPENCSLPKQRIEEVDSYVWGIPVGKVKLCIDFTRAAYVTNIVIYPGNSGSPVVDWTGRVVGVAFASDHTNWARVINLDDLKNFLDLY
jgi:S1-C subfamily serine protease